ncbi:MAG: alpha/beta hydrolase, partial [Maricaulaceae bacterium]
GGFVRWLLTVSVTNGNLVMEEARLTLGQKLALNPLTGPAFGQWIRYPMFAQQVQRAHGATGLSQADLRDLWALNQMNQGSRISHKVIQYLKERYRFQNTRWLPGFVAFDGPVHICWGARDTVAPVTVAHRLKALKPEARLSIFDDVGHFAQLQADPQWSAALMDFWNAA